MKFFTSRYTLALEEQVRDLKAEVLRLQQENAGLLAHIVTNQVGSITPPATEAKPEKKEPPKSVNWLRARSTLETPNVIVREAPLEQEKSANGTR